MRHRLGTILFRVCSDDWLMVRAAATGVGWGFQALTRICRSWKKISSVCRIIWNSPAERFPYICEGKVEGSIALSTGLSCGDWRGWSGTQMIIGDLGSRSGSSLPPKWDRQWDRLCQATFSQAWNSVLHNSRHHSQLPFRRGESSLLLASPYKGYSWEHKVITATVVNKIGSSGILDCSRRVASFDPVIVTIESAGSDS